MYNTGMHRKEYSEEAKKNVTMSMNSTLREKNPPTSVKDKTITVIKKEAGLQSAGVLVFIPTSIQEIDRAYYSFI